MSELPINAIERCIRKCHTESPHSPYSMYYAADKQLTALKAKIAEMELMEEILLDKIIELHMERDTQ